MAFGTWHDDNDDLYLVDSTGQRLLHADAVQKTRVFLGDLSKDELLTALLDRMDVNDLMQFVADANHTFKPGVMPEAAP